MDDRSHRRARRAMAAAAAWLATAGTAGAADGLLAYDGFDYTLGQRLDGQNGGTGWTSAWTYNGGGEASGSIVGGLSYQDANGRTLLAGGGAWATQADVFFAQAQRDTAASFGAAGTSVWMSFLVGQSADPTSGVNYAMGTVGRGYTFGSDAMLGGVVGDGAAVGPFYSSAGTITLPGTAPALSTTLIVLRLDFAAGGNDTMSLWFNPLLDGVARAADLTLSARDYDPVIGGVTLAHGDFRVFAFDEVRIGSSFAAVTPAVPEPAAGWLFGAGLAVLAARRCRQG